MSVTVRRDTKRTETSVWVSARRSPAKCTKVVWIHPELH